MQDARTLQGRPQTRLIAASQVHASRRAVAVQE